MSALFPTSLPIAGAALTTQTLAVAGHTALHNNGADESRAIATKIGTGSSTPTANTFLHGTAAGISSWAAVDLSTADVINTLAVAKGGTGTTTSTGTVNVVLSTSPTINSPTITAPTITGGGSWAGSPSIASPVLSGSTTGTYTLAGTPTISSPTITSPTISGTVTGAVIANANLSTTAGEIGGTWSTWTPTVTASTGTLTTVTTNYALYMQVGKSIFINADITITNVGTGSGSILVTLPVNANHTTGSPFYGRERGATGKSLNGVLNGVNNQISVTFYDNTFPGASSNILSIAGTYDAA